MNVTVACTYTVTECYSKFTYIVTENTVVCTYIFTEFYSRMYVYIN